MKSTMTIYGSVNDAMYVAMVDFLVTRLAINILCMFNELTCVSA